MTAKIICFASAKGGSGKTGLSATFGEFLSSLGKKVLLIDADFETTGLSLLYIKEVQVAAELIISKSAEPSGLCDLLIGQSTSVYDVAYINDYLSLLPATFNLGVVDGDINIETMSIFQYILERNREKYDFIIIDSQAGSGKMAKISMNRKTSDEVVIVSEYDPMSAAGVERLKMTLREDLTYERTWVLLNKLLPEFVKSFSDFLGVARYLNPIPWDAEVVRAYARRSLAIKSETANFYTLSIIQTVKGLFGESVEPELADWIANRVAVIKQPIEEQASDTEKELSALIEMRVRSSRLRSRKLILEILLSLIAALSISLLGYSSLVTFSKSFFQQPIASIFLTTTAILVGVIVFVSTLFSMVFSEKNRAASEILNSRMDRRKLLLEEKLKRLDTLKSLEPEELLRNNAKLEESIW